MYNIYTTPGSTNGRTSIFVNISINLQIIIVTKDYHKFPHLFQHSSNSAADLEAHELAARVRVTDSLSHEPLDSLKF